MVAQVVELKKKMDRSPEKERGEDMDKLGALISKIQEKGAEMKDADEGADRFSSSSLQ